MTIEPTAYVMPRQVHGEELKWALIGQMEIFGEPVHEY